MIRVEGSREGPRRFWRPPLHRRRTQSRSVHGNDRELYACGSMMRSAPHRATLRSSSGNEKERWKGLEVPSFLASRLREQDNDELHVRAVVREQGRVPAGVVVVEHDQRDPHDLRRTAVIVAVVIVVFVVSLVVPVFASATIAVVRVVPVAVVIPVVLVPALALTAGAVSM